MRFCFSFPAVVALLVGGGCSVEAGERACGAGLRRVESGAMELEFEKPRNVPGDSPALPNGASIISLVIYAVSGCLMIAAASSLFSSKMAAALNLFVLVAC